MPNITSPIRIRAHVSTTQQCYRFVIDASPEAKKVNLNAGFTEDRRPYHYGELLDLPSFNGIEIIGDKMASDYGLGTATNAQVQLMLDSVFGG